MRTARTMAFAVHVVCLAVGLIVAILAAQSAVENLPRDDFNVALARFVTAASLMAVPAAYCFALARRGFTSLAPLMFVFTDVSLGLFVGANARIMAKNFAPAAPEDLPTLYAIAGAEIVVALAVAFAAWLWTYRNSRFPLTDV